MLLIRNQMHQQGENGKYQPSAAAVAASRFGRIGAENILVIFIYEF
jgi:hypothetical protein